MSTRKKKRITAKQAKKMAKDLGWDFSKQFQQQSRASDIHDLVALARLKGYRKPKGCSSSLGYMFFQYLKKH